MGTSFLQVKNRAGSSLASGIDDDDLSLSVAAGEGAKFPSVYPFHITIDTEILSCTNRSTDTLTVTRGAEGTTPASHASGASVSLNITAQVIYDLDTAVNYLEAQSGAIFPIAPFTGQHFLHVLTGRKIEYVYDGSTWQPVRAYGATYIYVDKTDGTDDLLHGYGVDAAAFKTINYAYSMLPTQLDETADIIISAESYTEDLNLSPHTAAIEFVGTTTESADEIITGGDQGATSTPVKLTGTYSAAEYDNQIIRITKLGGVATSEYRVASQTTTTNVYLVGIALSAVPINNDTFRLVTLGTTLTGSIGVRPYTSGSENGRGCKGVISFWYMNLNSGGNISHIYSHSSFVYVYACIVTDSYGSYGLSCDNLSLVIFTVSVLKRTATGTYYGFEVDWHGQADIIDSKLLGYSISQGYAIRAMYGGLVSFQNSELSTWLYGAYIQLQSAMNVYSGGGVNPRIHGCGTGLYANKAGFISIASGAATVTYGLKMDGTADTNIDDLFAESDTGGFSDAYPSKASLVYAPFAHVDFTTEDSFAFSATGTGTHTWDAIFSETIKTGATADSTEKLTTGAGITNFSLITTGQMFKTRLLWDGSARTTSTVYVGVYQTATDLLVTDKHVGFKFINGAIWATVGNGTTETAVDTGVTFSAAWQTHTFIIICESATCIRFYVDGILKATITTNIPSQNNCYVVYYITNPTDAEDHGIRINSFDCFLS